MFSGTVRENLDPQGLHEDRALWQALEQCHLREVILSLGEYQAYPAGQQKEGAGRKQGEARDLRVKMLCLAGGLDGELGEGGRSLSLGQRQLLCLARALLTDAKVRQEKETFKRARKKAGDMSGVKKWVGERTQGTKLVSF